LHLGPPDVRVCTPRIVRPQAVSQAQAERRVVMRSPRLMAKSPITAASGSTVLSTAPWPGPGTGRHAMTCTPGNIATPGSICRSPPPWPETCSRSASPAAATTRTPGPPAGWPPTSPGCAGPRPGCSNAERQFRRIKGCKDMPVLVAALARHTARTNPPKSLLSEPPHNMSARIATQVQQQAGHPLPAVALDYFSL